jgi:hypothetical protein
MSVMTIEDDELADLFGRLVGLQRALPGPWSVWVKWTDDGSEETQIALAVRGLQIANMAALSASYGGETFIEAMAFADERHVHVAPVTDLSQDNDWLRDTWKLLRHCRYNVLSNNGYDWLPTEHGEVLDRFERMIEQGLAGLIDNTNGEALT